MKRYFLVLLFLALVVQSGRAQFEKRQLVIGVDGGPGVGMYNGDLPVEDRWSTHPGFALGVDLEIGMGGNVYFKTGLLYEAKGPGLRVDVFNDQMEVLGETDSWLRHSYTVVPLLINFRFGERIQATVGAGGYYGALSAVRQVVEPFMDEPRYSREVTEDYQRSDFGLSASLGLELPLRNSLWASVEFREHYGLTHVFDEEVEAGEEKNTLQSHLILVGVKYKVGG